VGNAGRRSFVAAVWMAAAFLLLTGVLLTYRERMERQEKRRGALMVAGGVLYRWDGRDFPETGVFDSTVLVGETLFQVRRTVRDVSPGVREMKLFVGEEGDRYVELTRLFTELR